MKIPKYLLYASFMSFLATLVVHGQKQTGFISLDCGLPYDAEYFDERTGLYYSSDASFIESGVTNNISSSLKSVSLDQQFHVLRSFPHGTRNCYTLSPALGKGNKYLIRARFMYGNYDGKGQLPAFDLHLGVELWDTVLFNGASNPVSKEIIHVASSDYIHVCLVNTGRGTPIISALEVRPLNNSMYEVTGSLNLILRLDMGSTLTGSQIIRYKDDTYDRLWQSDALYDCSNCTILSTTSRVDPLDSNVFAQPSAVMQTAFSVSDNSPDQPLTINWDPDNSTDQYYLYLHFAEVEFSFLKTREFNIYINDKLWWGPYQPSYWGADTVYGRAIPTQHTMFQILMNKTVNSTLPPLLNAMEVYGIKELFHSQTDENDVAAILKVKAMYGVIRNWQGDPCAPRSYIWSGLDCKSDGRDPPRIISMNISSSGLKGLIAPYITNLTKLESLDLSNNNLTGGVPDFLTGLASLKVLNLKGNNFTGSIPADLLSRSRKGLLSLSADENMVGNKESCESASCKKKRSSKFLVPIVATVAALMVLILAAWTIFWFTRRKTRKVRLEPQMSKTDGALEIKNRHFTYLEVLSMTNNFQRVVGKGGFGTVYHGHVEGTQVAVKILSPSSSQGYKEFQAEANILINVHHKNLTSLVGYCNEGTHIGLIYEYMANGNLESHLSDKNPYVLSWKHRLQIAMDAAQGLEYLHNGCKPAIVHRDVKTTNILLNEDFQAKLSDFGLSRAFPVEGETHISTVVAGTPGYLDPEYYTSNRLTEKSDVYSFGVVLLEMITSRPPIMRHQDETTHIIHWASSMLVNGDVKKIVDPRFRGDYDLNSVWKAVELAMVCVSRTSAERPAMNYVVIELKECLAAETAHHETGQDDTTGEIPMSLDSGLGPLAR